jgi:hypothetical protein
MVSMARDLSAQDRQAELLHPPAKIGEDFDFRAGSVGIHRSTLVKNESKVLFLA